MKKLLLSLIAVTIVGTIALVLVRSHKTSPYSLASVDGSIRAITTASGSQIMGMDRVSASIRGSQFSLLNELSIRLSGRHLYNDIDTYVLQDGTDNVHLTLYYSRGTVSSVDIRPSSTPSKLAGALKTGLTTAFPALDCDLQSP
jgi:hypothetical protein